MEYTVPSDYLFCYKNGKFCLNKFYNLNFPSKKIFKDIEQILKKSNRITLKMKINKEFLELASEIMKKIHISKEHLLKRAKEYIEMDTTVCNINEIPSCYLESLEEIVKYYVTVLTKYPPDDALLVTNKMEDLPLLILDALDGKGENFLRFIKESVAYSIAYARLQLLKEILEEKYGKEVTTKIDYTITT